MTGEPILPARTANQDLARYWFAVRADKIGSPVMRFIINRVPRAGGTAAPSVPIYTSAAYGCALAHSPQTTREVRATFYFRLSQTGPTALHAQFPSRSPVDYPIPSLGFAVRAGKIGSPVMRFMINRVPVEEHRLEGAARRFVKKDIQDKGLF
jgi:hypothetical protein